MRCAGSIRPAKRTEGLARSLMMRRKATSVTLAIGATQNSGRGSDRQNDAIAALAIKWSALEVFMYVVFSIYYISLTQKVDTNTFKLRPVEIISILNLYKL